jgi:uridine kinase
MNKTLIIGIAGGSGSGKSLFSRELVKSFKTNGGFDVPIITTDWFYHSLPDGEDGNTRNWDDPAKFDVDDTVRVLKELKENTGVEVLAPGHDYTRYRRIENANRLVSHGIVIIEGIFVLHEPRIRELVDVKLFMECDSDVMLARRIYRDVIDRGYPMKVVLERFDQFAKPTYEKFIEPSKREASMIIPNSGKTGINSVSVELIQTCMLAKLKKISELKLLDALNSSNKIKATPNGYISVGESYEPEKVGLITPY